MSPTNAKAAGQQVVSRAFSESAPAGSWPARGSAGDRERLTSGWERGWEPSLQPVRDRAFSSRERESSGAEEEGTLKPRPEFSFSRASAPPFVPQALQRFVGADGTNQAGKTIPFTLDDEFNEKHVAEDKAGAIENTQSRVDADDDLGGAMINQGTVGNTVATEEVWTEAINENSDEIPAEFYGPNAEDRTDEAFDAGDYDDSGYSGNSSYMKVEGWDVRLEDGSLEAEKKEMNRRVAGTYEVSDLDVSIEINHATQ